MSGKMTILVGHALERLRELPDESVHCCVTSPPYFGLRAYGTEPQTWDDNDPACAHAWGDEGKSGQRQRNGAAGGIYEGRDANKLADNVTLNPATGSFCKWCGAWRGELGLEPTPELYVDHLVAVFREVRRVLRADGTLWLNVGDSYANDGKWGGHTGGKHVNALHALPIGRNKRHTGLKPKDLTGVPWMLAFALRADGWYLRSDIIWSKPNPMTESVMDRPTKSHEYVFLLSKSERYYYDYAAVAEPVTQGSLRRYASPTPITISGQFKGSPVEKRYQDEGKKINGLDRPANRNMRSVWSISTHPYAEAHFATFPPALIEPPILAGTSEWGVCATCGAPWERIVEKGDTSDVGKSDGAKIKPEDLPKGSIASRTAMRRLGQAYQNKRANDPDKTVGWEPSCDCGSDPVPATVLDPFGGAGTTGVVADRLGRSSVLVELNPEYAEMARNRMVRDVGPLMRPEIVVSK